MNHSGPSHILLIFEKFYAKMDKKLIILVTGASSGIGFETAASLAKMGHKVYGAARRVEKMEPLKELGVVPMSLDVTDGASIKACVEGILAAEGRIDVLVNNAGYGYFGAVETVPMEDARRQIEVNVFGLAELSKLVIPSMRSHGFGRIINLSSVAGRTVLYFGGWYHVSKYSVEALSDAMRMELKPFGIDVVLIEPGGIRTDWGIIAAKHLEESSKGTAYEKEASGMAAMMNMGYDGKYKKLLSKPSVISNAICRAVKARRPKARYRTGSGSGLLVFLHNILPARWWDAIMRIPGKF